MKFLLEPDDSEPLNADERLDNAYGNYHIGREDESRDEIALFFYLSWLPEPLFLERGLWAIVHRHDGRLMAFSKYKSAEHSDEQLQELLFANVYGLRNFDVGSADVLSIAIVELEKSAVWKVDAALRAYTAFIGFGDVSWPNPFRSVVTAQMEYL